MKYSVSHDFKDESLEAKARWFLGKPLEERLREAFEDMDFIQKISKFELPDDRKTFKTFRVLELKASGRPGDIEDMKILKMAKKNKVT